MQVRISGRLSVITGVKFCEVRNCWSCCCCCWCSRRSCFCCSDKRVELEHKQRHKEHVTHQTIHQHSKPLDYLSAAWHNLKTHWVRTGSHSWEAESPVPVSGGWEVEAGDAERGAWAEGRSAQETGSRRSDCPAHRSCSAEGFLRWTPWARPPRAERSCQPDWRPPDHRSNPDSGRSAGAGWRRRGSAEEEECSGRTGRSYCGTDYQKGAPGTKTK